MLEAALLGTGGMMPLPHRYLTSLAVRQNGRLLLIDCGEGTQVTHTLLGWGFKNIDALCFTHFHADHISGLPGFLLAMGNSGRTEPVTITGPAGVENVVRCLLVIARDLPFDINFQELKRERGQALSVKCGEFDVSAYPVWHGTPCFAYGVSLPRLGKFDAERAKALGIPVRAWNKLQHGAEVELEGRLYTPDMVMGEPRKGLKIAYCTDTRPVAGLDGFVRGADLFICEGLYAENEMREKAAAHKHMVFAEAAKIARDGGVEELWLTHFSPAMGNPGEGIRFAREVFRNSHAGFDRKTKILRFEDEEADF
ncbi:MAG: ribonuclease Z [Clostridiales bacterium]|jgi:ribonuclease Z|nr:ribonuclease Z [Clostridiales bacterium]